MLDTLWKVIRKDLTAIIIAPYGNASILLAFAFGLADAIELYEQHSDAFMHPFGFDLSCNIMESE
jgi:hypothetical protein